MIEAAAAEKAPHKVCQYVFELANCFNSFYHDNHIISEEDTARKNSWLKLITLTEEIIGVCLDLLGIEVPDRM